MPVSSLILGIAGETLTQDERAFFRDADPWGFILFKRNLDNPAQTRALIDELRTIVGRGDAPVLIDQEGGRVQRLRPPHWPAYPPARRFGEWHGQDPVQAALATAAVTRLMAADLEALGITVDCMPVLDLPADDAHQVIGDRAYGSTIDTIAILGRVVCESLMAGGVLPVIKHIPGHGRARVDSHHSLPVVNAARQDLSRTDFAPFKALADMPMAMTAHVVYSAIDPDRPATLSNIVIDDVIRGEIGFDGLLMTDDLSMQALQGMLGARMAASIQAGCDVGLHCNGTLSEMIEVAGAAPALTGDAGRRARQALARLSPSQPFDHGSALRVLASLTAESV